MHDEKLLLEERLLKADSRLRMLRDTLDAMSHWIHAGYFLNKIAQTRQRIEELSSEADRKLAIVIVGPTGAGKSTLINALAGVDGLSATGNERPTTRVLTVFCSDPEDGRYFAGKVGSNNVHIKSSHSAKTLKNVVIVDTPDTNSTEAAEYKPLVTAAIRAADVLLCAFPVENAVRHDQIAYLGDWVREFNHEALYAIVTMSEKLPATELEKDVIEPLGKTLQENWRRPPFKTFAVSARSHLEVPSWGEKEQPHLGCRDDYNLLRKDLSENFNRMGAYADMRAARAEQWVEELISMIGRQAKECSPSAGRALAGIRKLETDIWAEAVAGFDRGSDVSGLEHRIACHLWGPVSWFIMMWAFTVQIVTLLMAAAGAFRRVASLGISTGLLGKFQSKDNGAVMGSDEIAQRTRNVSVTEWPDIGTAIRQAGFNREFQKNPLYPPPQGEDFCLALATGMRIRRNELMYKRADETLSGFGVSFFLNILFLLPALAFLYFMFQTYLTGGSVQAGISADAGRLLAMWWLFILSLMHGWIHWREKRINDEARKNAMLENRPSGGLAHAVAEEMARVIELAKEYGNDKKRT